MASRYANGKDVIQILQNRTQELIAKLGVYTEFFIRESIDEKGARIKISVKPGEAQNLPQELEFLIDSENILVPLEILEDFVDILPLHKT